MSFTSEECQSGSRSIAANREKSGPDALRMGRDPRSGRFGSRAAIAERLFGAATPGEMIAGRYQVRRRVGAGGMGVVDLAYDTALRRDVALKRLLPEVVATIGMDALRAEARALAALAHPNVVAVYDLIAEPDTIVVMEYVAGEPLHRYVHQAPDSAALLEVVRDAGWGLAAAHQVGLIHRDVKPSNILVARDGRVRVCDFGLARRAEASTDAPGEGRQTTRTGGTPLFMSPEQHAGAMLGPASDQYSLCATAWAVLTGRVPFPGHADRLERAKREGPPPWPEGLVPPHRAVPDVLRRGLAVRPADRWGSMEALIDALGPRRPSRRKRWARAALVAGVGVGALALVERWDGTAASGTEPGAAGQSELVHRRALDAALVDLDRLDGTAARTKFERIAEVAALDGHPDIAAEAAAWRASLYDPAQRVPPQTWVERARTLDEAATPSDTRAQIIAIADAVARIHSGDPDGGARAAGTIAGARPQKGHDRIRLFALRAQLAGLRTGVDPEAAHVLCGSSVASLRETHAAGHPVWTRTHLDCAAVARDTGHPEEALQLLAAVVRDGAATPEATGAVHVRRARLHLDAGRLDDAEASARAAAQILEPLHGDDAPALDELNLLRASIASGKGNAVAARRRLEKLRVTVESRLGTESRTLAVVHSRLAVLLRKTGEEEAADSHQGRAVEMFEASGEAFTAAAMRANWASGLAERGRYEPAEALLLAAKPQLDAHPRHGVQVPANAAWGFIHLGRGEFEAARRAFVRARSVQATIRGARNPVVGMLMTHEGQAQSQLGLDADPTFARAIELQMEGGARAPEVAFTRLRFAQHLWRTHRQARARAMFAQALPDARTRLGGEHELEGIEAWARREGIRVDE